MSLSVLPSELIIDIITLLDPQSLARLSQTCRRMCAFCSDDKLWRFHVQQNVPYELPQHTRTRSGVERMVDQHLVREGHVTSWREIWAGFHHVWFVLKQRFWISDRHPNGRLVFVLFDINSLQIIGYDLSAQDSFADPRTFSRLQQEPAVSIISFDPVLTRQRELFRLTHPGPFPSRDDRLTASSYNHLDAMLPPELRDSLPYHAVANLNKLMLARNLPAAAIDQSTRAWPPLCFPSQGRVRNPNAMPMGTLVDYGGSGYKPATMREASQTAVRLVTSPLSISVGNGRFVGISHAAEETLGALDPSVLYPTAEKPLQGIWIGDYSFHGNEFILFVQPDAHDASNLDIPEAALDTVEAVAGALRSTSDEMPVSAYSGALIGIKLTGDRNVPRSESSFLVPDLSRTLEPLRDRNFNHATILPAAAHLAEENFSDDRYSPAAMLILSKDRVAFHWMELNIITYFCRAKFDAFYSEYPPMHISQ